MILEFRFSSGVGGSFDLGRGLSFGFFLFQESFELGGVEDPTVGAANPVEQLRERFAPGFHVGQVLDVGFKDDGDFFFGEGVGVHLLVGVKELKG